MICYYFTSIPLTVIVRTYPKSGRKCCILFGNYVNGSIYCTFFMSPVEMQFELDSCWLAVICSVTVDSNSAGLYIRIMPLVELSSCMPENSKLLIVFPAESYEIYLRVLIDSQMLFSFLMCLSKLTEAIILLLLNSMRVFPRVGKSSIVNNICIK